MQLLSQLKKGEMNLGEKSIANQGLLTVQVLVRLKEKKITGIGRNFFTGTDGLKDLRKVTTENGRDPGRLFMDARGAILSFLDFVVCF